ncbi:unnamed protein product [Ambrosiozyma monospora]|uniref:Unnamed protein product n=1 Tax=Ambrosiozyma monospora TaxID=43982 RepID=A0A9W6YRI2_AMBMO|nr:unnamed protein product [Ambrosiozyma monospora]
MESLHRIADNPDNKCYICLQEQNELAPFCNMKESKDWVKPCSCSFIAHRKCFLSWVSSLDLQKRKDLQFQQQQEQRQEQRQQQERLNRARNLQGGGGFANQLLFRYSIQHAIFGIPFFRKAEKTNIFVPCPQCKRSICFKTPDSTLLNLKSTLDTTLSNMLKVGLISGVVSATSVCLTVGCFATAATIGMKITDRMAPDSVQLSLFDVYPPFLMTCEDALKKELIPGGKFLAFTLGVPFHLLMLRSNWGLGLAKQLSGLTLLPMLLYSGWENLKTNPAKMCLFASVPLKVLHAIIFKLTLNRIYYRWCKQVQACFIADRLSLEELDRIEKESMEEYELEELESKQRKKSRRSRRDSRETSGWSILSAISEPIQHFLSYFKFTKIQASRLKREVIICLKFDYSSVFQSKKLFLLISTTLLWPQIGEMTGKLLEKNIPILHDFISESVNTPNEAIFVRNFIGCFAVAILKDFVNLYFNYRKFKQLKEIDVVYGVDPELARFVNSNQA